MKATHDVFILQLAAHMPSQFREVLIAKGFPTHVGNDATTAIATIESLQDPILIVFAGDELETAFENTKQTIALTELHRHPLVFIGKEVDSYEKVLSKHFPVATTLTTPCSTGDLIEAINYLVRHYRKAGEHQRGSSVRNPATPASQALRLSENPPAPIHDEYSQFESIPNLFFHELQRLKFGPEGIGGTLYPRSVTEAFIRSGGYLPEDSQFDELVNSVLTDAGKWGRLHLCRVAYIATQLLKAMEMPAQQIELAKLAIFIYPSSFVGDAPDLLRREYHDARYTSFRRELCSRIKDSAMNAAVNMNQPELASLLSLLGKLIGREEQSTKAPLTAIAATIMAADITDRVCFQAGHWQPRKAYLWLKKIRAEQLNELPPQVLCALVKFLSEAMTANPFALMIPLEARRNPKLIQAAAEWRDQRVTPQEKKVPLVNLMPGMKLSRPVVTFDGREILPGDLSLDQDLIWRLWQLSTVRPLNGPLVIFSDN